MFMIINLSKPRLGKLIFNHLIENNCPEFHNELLDSYCFIPTLGGDCVKLSFWAVTFNTILTQLYYKNISRFQSTFKPKSRLMSSLNVTPKLSFEPSFVD